MRWFALFMLFLGVLALSWLVVLGHAWIKSFPVVLILLIPYSMLFVACDRAWLRDELTWKVVSLFGGATICAALAIGANTYMHRLVNSGSVHDTRIWLAFAIQLGLIMALYAFSRVLARNVTAQRRGPASSRPATANAVAEETLKVSNNSTRLRLWFGVALVLVTAEFAILWARLA